MQPSLKPPTEAELEVLQVLWRAGPATVRTVNDRLNEKRRIGYTTTLKTMQIMTEKGMLHRDEQGRSHIYTPSQQEQETQKVLLDRILERAFGGSAAKLVMGALRGGEASRQEISEIRALLEEMEGQGK